jgi:4-amino-4-deoxy-L-arabinose transferase-like glycosyltransferase
MKPIFRTDRVLLILFALVYLFRFASSMEMGIMPQDAYYYLYSEYLDWSYFDHPPAVAYMLRISSELFGQSVAVLKATNFVVSLLALIAFYYLSSLFVSKRKALYSTIFYGVTLQLTVLSMVTTPDVPLLLFWTLSLIAFFKALEGVKWHWWAVTGLLIGLSFMSKYTGVFLLAGVFGFLILSRNHRHYLLSWQMSILLLCALIPAVPIVWWNYSNDWISFKFQSAERADDVAKFALKPKYFFGNIGTQMLLLIPVGFVVLFAVFYKQIRKILRDKFKLNDHTLFLLIFSLPIILFFYGVSWIYWVKLNWTMSAYIAGFVLISRYLNRRLVLVQLIVSLVIHLLLYIQISEYLFQVKSDDTWEGWVELAAEVKKLKVEYPDHFIFSADGYKTSAVLNFYLNEHVYSGNVVGLNGLQFSLINSNLVSLAGRDALYIDSQRKFLKSYGTQEILNLHFQNVLELSPIIVYDEDGNPQRIFAVYECLNYRHPVLVKNTP